MDWNGACEGRPPHQRQLQCKVVWLLSKKELGEKRDMEKQKCSLKSMKKAGLECRETGRDRKVSWVLTWEKSIGMILLKACEDCGTIKLSKCETLEEFKNATGN